MKTKKLQLLLLAVMLASVVYAAWPGAALAASRETDSPQLRVQQSVNCSYRVAAGDTLYRVALRYGTSVYTLTALNGLYNPNFIYAGMVLAVPCGGVNNPPPPPSGICSYYLVRPGDYLQSIAVRFGTTWQAIARVNGLYSPNLIYSGTRLAIPCGSGPEPGPSQWKSYTSTKHHYTVNYPADWTISVQPFGPNAASRDAEYVFLHPAATSLPAVQILALKGAPPIGGFENCNKNLLFRGVQACSISLPRGQQPATKLLIFQKGDSYYHISAQYELQQQLGVFEEIVKSFQFTP